MRRKFPLMSLFLLIFWVLSGQELVIPEKSFFIDSLHRFYTQTDLPLYVQIASKPGDPSPVTLSQTDHADKDNVLIPMYMDGNGKHTLRHKDALHNTENVFVIYADGTPPSSSSLFTGAPVYTAGGKIYYGKNLTVTLSTRDDLSGVKAFLYSLNGEKYHQYLRPLIVDKEGNHILKYYAFDQVGNVENLNERAFTVDLTPPVTEHKTGGVTLQGKILSASSDIWLESSDNISGVDITRFGFNDEGEKLYLGGKINFTYLPEGENTLWFYSVDKVRNVEEKRKFEFFYDKTPPIIATDILGDRFIVNDRIYFSGRTKLKITAVDNKTGIKTLRYAINDLNFKDYEEPFYLPSRQGIHIVRYYAVDSLDNATADLKNLRFEEFKHNVSKIFVDLTGPSLEYAYDGPNYTSRDTVFINDKTRIRLSFTDAESGPQHLAYAKDGNPAEIDYTGPFSIHEAGWHTIQIVGYDNVNNRNQRVFGFVVDNKAPVIDFRFSVQPIGKREGLDVYPPFVALYLAPHDDLSGIERVGWSLNGAPEQPYQSRIAGFSRGQKHRLIVTASDKLGNTSTKTFEFYINEK
ncbi:MAG: OmpL47-type beta-barrel domain-containing protein [Bacteroidales bacterium]